MIYARFLAKAQGCLRLRSLLVRQCLAELLGVFVLIMITISASAQTVTSEGKKGGYISSALASGVSVMVAIHISGGVSDAIHHYSNGTLTVTGPRETASIFATYPAPYLSLRNGFLDQVLGTGILVVSILALIDSRNKSMAKGMEPLGVGLLVLSLSLAMGANCSCAINPARDLGPRLFTYVAGWGPQVFSAGNYWWWVPIVAPMVGSATGTAVYQLCVAFHHPPDEDDAFSLPATEKDHRGTEKDIDIPIFAVNKYVDTWMEGNSVVVPATEHVKRETAPSP
ncbi:aquaporin-10 isoform X2 [Eublepharis macularius]|uniref:Aquaporin-10 isoform X2 n=1 Tax=Eublepharis macularius TaxID=481883 RepID=A0AA97JLT6_EUBMA|nr:aquaporin-10 isoform X2 [Eublepharis macularius]